MIYTELTTSTMINDLMSDEYAKWTYDEAEALAEYYAMLSDDIGDDIEWDTVAIRCDWSSYADLEELKENYLDIEDEDDLNDHTHYLKLDNGTYLVQNF